MSFANVNELSNHEFGVLCPSILNTQRKLQKTKILPNISPKEHRLFVQKPSLNKNYSKPKENLSIFKEIIERSLGKARESTPSVPSQRKHLKKTNKILFKPKKNRQQRKTSQIYSFSQVYGQQTHKKQMPTIQKSSFIRAIFGCNSLQLKDEVNDQS